MYVRLLEWFCYFYCIVLNSKMNKDTLFSRKYSINIRGKLVDLSTPAVMGILNISPDSFYSGSRIASEGDLLAKAGKMIREGARFLDLGACSTRPGAEEISEKEELNRLIPALDAIRKVHPDIMISVDTRRAAIARLAVSDYRVDMINDISAGVFDPKMFETVAGLQVPYIIMHMRGNPSDMQTLTHYDDLLKEIFYYFSEKTNRLFQMGVRDIILDPGFGFAKTMDQNYQVLNRLEDFRIFGLPLLAGLSRKSMIYKFLGTDPPGALNGTTVLNTLALYKGVNILRVHDVREGVQAVKLLEKMEESQC